MPCLGAGIGLINLSSPLHRKAQPSALFISSTSHKPNQSNLTTANANPWQWLKEPKKYLLFCKHISSNGREENEREDQTKPPLDIWLKTVSPVVLAFSTDARQLQPDPLIPGRYRRGKGGGGVRNIINKNRMICTSGNLVGD